MILFTQDLIDEVQLLHETEGKSNEHNIDNIVRLTNILNTSTVAEGGVSNCSMYWEFLNATLDNIRYGTWVSFPNMWTEVYRLYDNDNLTTIQEAKEKENYFNNRTRLLRDLNIPMGLLQERKIMLKWLRNRDGFLDMLKVAFALSNMHIVSTSVPIIYDYPD